MAKIDVIDAYQNRCIEGVDKSDLLNALMQKNGFLTATNLKRQFRYKSGRTIYLDCAQKYFMPEKSYFHLNERSRCNFIQKAFGIAVGTENCNECLRQCIEKNLAIKKETRKISRNYFEK